MLTKMMGKKCKALTIDHPEKVGMDPTKLAQAFQIIKEGVEKKIYPGAVALIGRGGIIVKHKAYGKAVLVPEEKMMKADTIFDLASLTKPIATGTSMMILAEQGKITLDDKAVSFIPELKSKKEITIRHLLTHTSGLPAWADLYSSKKSHREIIRQICNLDLVYPPGSKVVYSCLGFILLGEIIPRISGRSLAVFSWENIFAPLNMKNTFFTPPAELRYRIAASECCHWRKRILIGEVHDENAYALGGYSGNAGLFSNAYDLAIFSQTFLNEGEYDGIRILLPGSIKEMIRNQTEGLNEAQGLGWRLKANKNHMAGNRLSFCAYGHTGFTGTSLWIDPVRQLFIILLTNRVHPRRGNVENISKIRSSFNDGIIGSIVE